MTISSLNFCDEINQQLTNAVPRLLRELYPDFAKLVMCGALFREGLEDSALVHRVAGMRKDRVVLRIIRILQDVHASRCYFELLDRCEALTDGCVLRAFRIGETPPPPNRPLPFLDATRDQDSERRFSPTASY